jgi:hypothetical protein
LAAVRGLLGRRRHGRRTSLGSAKASAAAARLRLGPGRDLAASSARRRSRRMGPNTFAASFDRGRGYRRVEERDRRCPRCLGRPPRSGPPRPP